MAAVYAARVVGAESFEKRVALKVMLPHLSRDAKFEKMFGDEARVAGQVVSPYVVATIDLGRDEHEGLYQVLDLVIGASLRQLLDAESEPLPTDVALTMLAQVARGLADAHAARGTDGSPLGLVHRDVSPHNVLVGVDGRARLSDFGVARAAASVSTTESGELKGKLAYAAPEQLGGEVADASSDVFALGIVAWEVLAHRRLFQGDNPLALVDAMLSRPIPRLSEVREVSPALDALVASALVRARADRTLTASDLATGFENAAREMGGLATPERIAEIVRARGGSSLAAIEAALRAPLPAQAPIDHTPPPSRRAPMALLLIGVAAIAVLAWAWPRPTPIAPPPRTVAATVVLEPDAYVARPPAIDAAPPEALDAGTTTIVETEPRRPRPPRPEPVTTVAPEPPVTETPQPPPTTGLLGVEDFDRTGPR
jgi:serine/threonine-protein kinase